jgi:hypothetical protein
MCICLQAATRNWRQQLVRKHNKGCAANSTFAAATPHWFQSNAVDVCSRARANGELPKSQYRGLGQVLAASAPATAAQAGGAVECTPAAPQEDSEHAATYVSPTEAVASSAAASASARALKRALHAPIDLAQKRASFNSQARNVGMPPSQQLGQADGVHLTVAAATRPSALAAAAAPRVAAQSVQLASLRAAAASRRGATASTSATPASAWLSLREASEREALEDTDMEDVAPHELEDWGSMQASAIGAHGRVTAVASGKSGSARVSFLSTVSCFAE